MGMITLNITDEQQLAVTTLDLDVQAEFSRFLNVYVREAQEAKIRDLRTRILELTPAAGNSVLDTAIDAAKNGQKK